jgi:hypothetical protein
LSPHGGVCFVLEVVLPFHGIPVSHINGVAWGFVIGRVLARVVKFHPDATDSATDPVFG